MADRLLRMTDGDLGAALAAVAPDLAFPERAVDLAAMAVARIRAEGETSVRRSTEPGRVRRWVSGILPPRGVRRALVLALLIVALSAIAAGAAYFGVRGIQIVFENGGGVVPSASGSPSALPSPTLPSLGDTLDLGSPSTLAAARAAADFPVAEPPNVPGMGTPLVFLSDQPFGGRVSFVWVSKGTPRLLLTEFHADPNRPFIRKLVFSGTSVERVNVNGERGYWISGAAHELDYLDEDGIPFNDTTRLAGDTLVWTRGDVTLRLESADSLAEALRIARATR
jgi:hypothetical protein